MKLYIPYSKIVPISQKFNQNFNTYYKSNGLSGHTGFDFVGQHQETIYASCDGYIYSDVNKDNKDLTKYRSVYQLVEDNGLVYEVSYGHLNEIFTKPKTEIKKGDPIGTQGATGNVFVGGVAPTLEQRKNGAGSHLHFQVRLCKPVDKVDKSKTYIRGANGIIKFKGKFLEIPYFDNGLNGCIDPEPFMVYKPATTGFIEDVFKPEELTQILKFGDRGTQVKLLQKKLGITPQDGIFGWRTELVLKHFQETNGLVPDGVCGKLTIAKLK